MDFSALLDTQSGVFAQGLAALSGVCAFICVFLPAPTERSGALYRLVYGLLNWIVRYFSRISNSVKPKVG